MGATGQSAQLDAAAAPAGMAHGGAPWCRHPGGLAGGGARTGDRTPPRRRTHRPVRALRRSVSPALEQQRCPAHLVRCPNPPGRTGASAVAAGPRQSLPQSPAGSLVKPDRQLLLVDRQLTGSKARRPMALAGWALLAGATANATPATALALAARPCRTAAEAGTGATDASPEGGAEAREHCSASPQPGQWPRGHPAGAVRRRRQLSAGAPGPRRSARSDQLLPAAAATPQSGEYGAATQQP